MARKFKGKGTRRFAECTCRAGAILRRVTYADKPIRINPAGGRKPRRRGGTVAKPAAADAHSDWAAPRIEEPPKTV